MSEPLHMQPVNKAVLEYGKAKAGRNPYALSRYNAEYYAQHKEEISIRRKLNYYKAKAAKLKQSVIEAIEEALPNLNPESFIRVMLPYYGDNLIMNDCVQELRALYAEEKRVELLTVIGRSCRISIHI